MSSTGEVNFSLRPSKAIQRSIIFSGIRDLITGLSLPKPVYVGFGSVWFVDFMAAFRTLDCPRMISMESDDIVFARAAYNVPFSHVKVLKGRSYELLPKLLADTATQPTPWVLWLDYDQELSESSIADLDHSIEALPPNSLLLTTVNAKGERYGKPEDRLDRIRNLLGDVVPDDLQMKDLDGDATLPVTLARLLSDYIRSVAIQSGRSGGCVPCFRVGYIDSAAMVTVGVFLPDISKAAPASALVAGSEWPGLIDEVIEAPHLTMLEIAALRARLPTVTPLDRDTVRELGFDLSDKQISAFQRYFRHFPIFAQVVA